MKKKFNVKNIPVNDIGFSFLGQFSTKNSRLKEMKSNQRRKGVFRVARYIAIESVKTTSSMPKKAQEN